MGECRVEERLKFVAKDVQVFLEAGKQGTVLHTEGICRLKVQPLGRVGGHAKLDGQTQRREGVLGPV